MYMYPTGHSDDDDHEDDEKDLAHLLAYNEHPPEYYIWQINEFDEVKDTEENYSEETILLLNRIEERWHM